MYMDSPDCLLLHSEYLRRRKGRATVGRICRKGRLLLSLE